MANTKQGLVLLDRANQLLAKAHTFEDVKEVRNLAEAARTFAKAARLGLELQNRAAEVKLRAERKAGAFLAELHLRGGNRRSKSRPVTLKLDDLGVTKRQSETWQRIASVPDEHFEQYVRGKSRLGQEVTASGLLNISRSLRSSCSRSVSKPHFVVPAAARPPTLGRRAELPSLLADLREHCRHLRELLEPLVAGQKAVYKTAERRYIGRLSKEMEQAIQELELHLWSSE